MSAAELLGEGGPFATTLGAYEARPGQLEMARAVERTLSQSGVLLCEAGTGTGKTLAYLVPALLSGRKVIISTATRALQDQIAYKDVPLAMRALDITPRVAVMKGLSNYVCRRRLSEFLTSSGSEEPRHKLALGSLTRWVQETETGDISELSALQEGDPVWREVTSSSDTRVGPLCPHYDECFVTQMKREAEAARLVIVNHHLFFADLALRGPHPGRVLPDYDAVIFDEAHQIEDVATQFFGTSLSRARLDSITREGARSLTSLGADLPLLRGAEGQRFARLLDGAELAGDGFFRAVADKFPAEIGRTPVEPDDWRGPLEAAYHQLDSALLALGGFATALAAELREPRSAPKGSWGAAAESLEIIGRKADGLREDLAKVIEGGAGYVSWVDTSGRSPRLASAPVDVAPMLRQGVFERVPSVVLTSATLTSVGSSRSVQAGSPAFAYLRSRVGLTGEEIEATELVVPSPFDFERMARLYTPRDLPSPRDPRFSHEVVERVRRLVEITGGGAFVLTTSVRAMRAIHRGLAQRLGAARVLLQGEAPKSALLARFRMDKSAVLVATMSFWEGVDVPGDALRLVVLEKIPFAVPTDPIVRARGLLLEAEGRNAFMEQHVPQAAITLKQGFGRLIRTQHDRGVVALFDERVHRQGYGAKLLSALPPAPRVYELEEVREFWESQGEGPGDA